MLLIKESVESRERARTHYWVTPLPPISPNGEEAVRRTARCRALCGSFSAGCNGAFTARWRVDFVPVEKPGKTRIDS